MKKSAGNKTLKIAVYILTVALVLTAFPVMNGAESYAAKTFNDVNGHWGKPYIEEAAELGIVSGYPEGDFKPDNLMKREEFFSMVVKILTEKPVITEETAKKMATFGDIIPGEWYVSTIQQAVAAGITEGQTYYSFGIGMMITRQEAAKVVSTIISDTENMTAEQIAAGKTKYDSLKDVGKISDWAKEHVEKVVTKGYVKGDDKGNFNPTNALTRAEAATLLLNVVKNEKTILGPKQEKSQTDLEDESGQDEGDATDTPIGNNQGDIPAEIDKIETFDYEIEKKITPKPVQGSDIGCKCPEDKTRFKKGSGNISDPYVIETDVDLNHIREHATQGAYFVLKNDIYISKDFAINDGTRDKNPWEEGLFIPIGSKQDAFNGHLDGNGYGIYDMIIQGSQQYAAMFACIDKTGSVENLTIHDSSFQGGQYVGAFVGFNEGSIKNCTVGKNTEVKGSNYVGGIAGYTKTILSDNRNKGTVESAINSVGGIAGGTMHDSGIWERCVNDGTVKGSQNVGGIVGSMVITGNDFTVQNCSNLGTVESKNSNAGGILGSLQVGKAGIIKDCFNRGTVKGTSVNGGIISEVSEDTIVRNCFNLGTVEGSMAGGIFGRNTGSVEFCANLGNVKAQTNAGGIGGSQDGDYAIVEKCYNKGNITAENIAGGIIGENGKKVTNCYNLGIIESKVYSGGIVGRNKGIINYCYNVGQMKGNMCGEIVGFNRTANVSFCFWPEDSAIGAFAQSDGNDAGRAKNSKPLTKAQLQVKEEIQIDDKTKLYFPAYMNEEAEKDIWDEVIKGTYPELKDFHRKSI